MRRQGTFPALAVAAVVVAGLALAAGPGGWLIAAPVGLAVAVAFAVRTGLSR